MNQTNTPQYYAPAPLPSSTLATVSLICGILGFTAFPLLGSIVALITGYQARKETRSVPPSASGDGNATAGIVMGWIGVGLGAAGFCCFLAYMVFMLGLFGSSLQGWH